MFKGNKPIRYVFLAVLLAGLMSGSAFFLKRLAKPNGMNILLISIDALRPDHLGCYGYKEAVTPNIDGLARQGVMFTQAIAQASNTFSSLPSIITSTYPHTHWVLGPGASHNPSVTTLFSILKKRGYRIGFISDYELLDTIPLLNSGLEVSEDLRRNLYRQVVTADKVSQEAVKWLDKNKDMAFFLYLHYLDPHGPYRMPEAYKELYGFGKFNKNGRNISRAGKTDDQNNTSVIIPEYIRVEGITDPRYYISQYDAEISFTDAQIGIVLDRLKELGLDKKTLVVIFADHGEGLVEHGYYFTHVTLYDEVLRIPLIIRQEGLLPDGKQIDTQVEAIDIAPTILEISGIDKDRNMEGVSLLPLIFKKGASHPACAFSDIGSMKSIRKQGWKLIYDKAEGAYELYDLEDDPGETCNLAGIEKDKFISLKKDLDSWMGQSRAPVVMASEPLSEDAEERLRSMGYLQ